jgi:hypothetical protein
MSGESGNGLGCPMLSLGCILLLRYLVATMERAASLDDLATDDMIEELGFRRNFSRIAGQLCKALKAAVEQECFVVTQLLQRLLASVDGSLSPAQTDSLAQELRVTLKPMLPPLRCLMISTMTARALKNTLLGLLLSLRLPAEGATLQMLRRAPFRRETTDCDTISIVPAEDFIFYTSQLVELCMASEGRIDREAVVDVATTVLAQLQTVDDSWVGKQLLASLLA